MANKLEKGVINISLDVEGAWGWLPFENRHTYLDMCKKSQIIIPRLLKLFEKYNIKVNLAICGAYSLTNKNDIKTYLEDNRFYRPTNDDYLLKDQEEAFFYPNIFEIINKSTINHEISSHTFSHIYHSRIKDNVKSRLLFFEDLKKNNSLLGKKSKNTINSFVYPKNETGHLDVLKDLGLNVFRGNVLETAYSYLDSLKRLSPIYNEPMGYKIYSNDILGIQSSQYFCLPKSKLKTLILKKTLISRTINGIEKAIVDKNVFSVWFHPYDFGYKTESNFELLEELLKRIDILRTNNQIDILTFNEIYEKIIIDRSF